jgi:AraC family transcriptional regulator
MGSANPVERDFLGTIVRRRMIAGLRLTETVLRPQSRTPRHFHDNSLLGWSLKGGYTNTYTRGLQEIESSRIMYCPGGETHTTSTGAGAVSFALELEPAWVERLTGAFLPSAPTMFELGSLAPLIARLYGEFNEKDTSSGIAIEGIALEMVAVAMRFRKNPGGSPPRWLAGVRDLLHERFREQITISAIAKEVDIHPVYLASTFRSKYGHSIVAYVRELRIDYAARQLAGSEDSLAAIAQMAGFSDQSHFCRIFKRTTGMTPAAYRAVSGRQIEPGNNL